MSGLDIITDAILDKAKEQKEAILKEAEAKKNEILKEAKDRAENDCLEIKNNALKKAENIEALLKQGAEGKLSREFLKKKSDLIKEVLKEAEETVLSLPREEYNSLLLNLLSKNAREGREGEIVFSQKDKEKISDEVMEKAKALNLIPSFDGKNIQGGFILKYGKIAENCSVEAIFNENREKATDFLNKELFKGEKLS